MNEVIKDIGGKPLDVLFQLLEANGGSIPAIYFHHDEKDMEYALKQPFVSIGSDGTALSTEGPLSKGYPHPRSYGTFPRVLGRYVRDQRVLTLAEAVRKMTSLAASNVGLADRGTIAPRKYADLVLFDPRAIADRATTAAPHAVATGIDIVWVNGEIVFKSGGTTGVRPGRVLTRDGK